MENKNLTIIICLLALIVGLLLGYFFGANNIPHRGLSSTDSMYEEMEEHMGNEIEGHTYGNEMIDDDGELQHMMSEMMLIGRGQTGELYEEAWLRGMVVHHLGAIEMSEQLLKETSRPELIELANDIIGSQSAEVEQMKGWLNSWFNGN